MDRLHKINNCGGSLAGCTFLGQVRFRGLMSGTGAHWLAQTDAAIQRAHDEAMLANAEEIGDILRRAIESIEPPPDQLHAAALKLKAMWLCRALLLMLHRVLTPSSCDCYRSAWRRADTLMRWAGDPRHAMRQCIEALLADFDRAHPPTGASMAARIIRADSGKRWRGTHLTGAASMSPARLRRDFQRVFGFGPSAYVHLVRVTKAVAMLSTDIKVDAIAGEVGYRSKKDFYRALKRWVGCTPTELRALSCDERCWLEQQLRAAARGRVRRVDDAR
jgi:AraC-like DNA-binding protein